MLETFYISERFFTKNEIDNFRNQHGYDIKQIEYSSAVGEIDFLKDDEKEFLLKKGYPEILSRFFA